MGVCACSKSKADVQVGRTRGRSGYGSWSSQNFCVPSWRIHDVAEHRCVTWHSETEIHEHRNERQARRQQGKFLSTIFPVLYVAVRICDGVSSSSVGNNQELLNSIGVEMVLPVGVWWLLSFSLHSSIMSYSVRVLQLLLQSLPICPGGGGNKSLLTLSKKYFQQGDVGLCRNWMVRKRPFSTALLWIMASKQKFDLILMQIWGCFLYWNTRKWI